MKYVDVLSLFEGEAAHIAFLATFQFDPDYFERRLLRSPALQRARRILVFVDRAEWLALLRRDIPARYINRRYLVVPVERSEGRFHPKLGLLLFESGGRLLCGSNNLTRAGCSSNLELVNAVCFEHGGKDENEKGVAREAFGFFQAASAHADAEIARIANEWLQETVSVFPWLRQPAAQGSRTIRLLHTYDGPLWQELKAAIGANSPKEFLVCSPFHDVDAALFKRLSQTWPAAKIEVLAQQGYTTLPVAAVKRVAKIHLSEVVLKTSRRLHAKLIAWEHRTGSGCLIGSANFTCNAFDGRNVETCLLLTATGSAVGGLFDQEVQKRPIALKDFEPGVREVSPAHDPNLPRLNIESAVLIGSNKIRVTYSHNVKRGNGLALAIRRPGERHPRVRVSLAGRSNVSEAVTLPELALTDAAGALLANLVADIDGTSIEGPSVWVIDESRLTYEPGEGAGTVKRRVEETGEGLHELLDEIGKRDGISGVIDFLQHFSIRFYDGDGNAGLARRFSVSIRDPYQADVAPDWLKGTPDQRATLGTAVMEFVDRHERQRLRRHAKRGNINGMENFLDVFTALVRLLYVYTERGVVKRLTLMRRCCTFIELATKGSTDEDDPFDGYLSTVAANIGRGSLLKDRCAETNYLAVVGSALLIARRIRSSGEKDPAQTFLPTTTNLLTDVIVECRLTPPPRERVRDALTAYRMLSDQEIEQLLVQME